MNHGPDISLFDAVAAPLDGCSLIEASAGTGKTFTIAALFIRMIVEKRLLPGQILVVTFTQAATEELRTRIRSAIREAVDAFTAGATDHPLLQQMLAKYQDHAGTAALLVTALRSFDEAAVHTIHGFCQRMLEENAFESGSLFDTELESDDACLREIVQDFWRHRFYDAPDEIAAFAATTCSPDNLLRFIRKNLPSQRFKLLPDLTAAGPPAMTDCRSAYDHVRYAWKNCREEVAAILATDPGLKRSTYRADSVSSWILAMDDYVDRGMPLDMFDKFANFCQTRIDDSIKKGHEPPCHAFFGLCDALYEVHSCASAALDRYFLSLKSELVVYIQRELPRRRLRKNTRSFDDILLDFHSSLHGAQNESLREAVRQKFPVALIDEFQDTDPIQYEIFRAIYSVPETTLFLIGDPKQAIYSFRGADVFAYFRASEEVDHRYTLGRNWRSVPRLVDGVNALFAAAQHPFVFPEILFHPVEAGLQAPADADPPLNFWFLARNGDETISSGAACDLLARSVAAEIERITIAGHVNGLGNIAVLVRSNQQADLMAEVLRTCGIPSVVCSAGSVFKSASAGDLLHLLKALLDPADEGLVRRALATDIFGMTASDLHCAVADEKKWLEWLEKFHYWRALWEASGVIVMARTLFAGEGVRARLLQLPDGERRLTDLLQCIELLQQAEHDDNLGLDRLHEWLRRRILEQSDQDEHLVRLETDDDAVKIVTIHKSKGLEYDVVFCPFCWGGSREKKDIVTYHDRSTGDVIVDLGSDDFDGSRLLAEEELLAENLRLLYVAVTRARRRCYVAWGGIRDAGTSSLAYILHGREMFGCGERIPLTDDDLLARLYALRDAVPGSVAVNVLSPPEDIMFSRPNANGTYDCARFTGRIAHDWRIASFSSLARTASRDHELPDRDHVAVSVGDSALTTGSDAHVEPRFAFPKGATAGTFLHEVFERIDFQAPPAVRHEQIGRGLRRYGFSGDWHDCITDIVGDVLDKELVCPTGRFRLADIPAGEKLPEMEFHLPVAGLGPGGLADLFSRYGSSSSGDTIRSLSFEPVKGYLKGFIDLVFRYGNRFYIVDWKSNHLGNTFEAYRPTVLAEVMERELYVLQAHLYAVAVHRYISQRVTGYSYDLNFGGIFYLFLRGMRKDDPSGTGVYYTCPERNLIEGLSALFAGEVT